MQYTLLLNILFLIGWLIPIVLTYILYKQIFHKKLTILKKSIYWGLFAASISTILFWMWVFYTEVIFPLLFSGHGSPSRFWNYLEYCMAGVYYIPLVPALYILGLVIGLIVGWIMSKKK